jgi:SAM-dependent methyltransferase
MVDWNRLFADPNNVLDVPEPLAVELAEALPPRARVLDLGCGAGRHLPLMVWRGLVTVGVDVAPNGLARSRERLESLDLTAHLVRGDFRRPLPFPDRAFDAVLTVKTVNHGMPEDGARAFHEAGRVLRPGGRLVAIVISDRDARFGDGEEIAERTFVHRSPPEAGVPHHYFTEAELRRLLAGFSFVDLSLTERYVSPAEPIFGRYRFRPGVAPWLRHWHIRAVR